MLNKKYCEPYMIAAFIIIVILGVLYIGTAKINLQYVRGVEISRADILIRSELLMLRTSIMYIVLLLVFTRTIRNDFLYCNILQHKKRTVSDGAGGSSCIQWQYHFVDIGNLYGGYKLAEC